MSGRVELGWIGMALDENQQMEGRFAAWMRGTENKTCDVMRQGCIGWGPNMSMLLEASDGRRHMKSSTERESLSFVGCLVKICEIPILIGLPRK